MGVIFLKQYDGLSRRKFIKGTGLAALGTSVSGSLAVSPSAHAESRKPSSKAGKSGPYNILMIVTDQERYLEQKDLPPGYRLPGHERLAKQGVTFENHQIGSCVCTPSRAVLYTGQHIQNNGMFDNTNFPWSGSLSTDIDTLGDLMRRQGYYTAYKGTWHLTEEFETANKLHAPERLLSAEMEEYGFSDYMGIGDICDGQYRFSRYFSPLEHHTPKTIEQLFENNDVELYDLINDPLEMKNLALDINQYGETIVMMNEKLNVLIEAEVGEDIGQMLPSLNGADWTLSSSIDDFRP